MCMPCFVQTLADDVGSFNVQVARKHMLSTVLPAFQQTCREAGGGALTGMGGWVVGLGKVHQMIQPE
jgi:hypothetical protein